MLKKRGFTTLAITVLAFSLLVAVGVTVVTRLVAFQFKGETSCHEVRIELGKIKKQGSEFYVCDSSSITRSDISFKVANSGSVPIKGLSINLKGKKGIEKKLAEETIRPGLSMESSIQFNRLKYGELDEVVIIPRVGRQKYECFESLVSTDSIGAC